MLFTVLGIVLGTDAAAVGPEAACADVAACAALIEAHARPGEGLGSDVATAASRLAHMPDGLKTLDGLLRSKKREVRDAAAYGVGTLGAGAGSELDALSAAADDGSGWALWALARIGDAKAIPVIARHLDGPGSYEHLAPFGAKALPAALDSIEDVSASRGTMLSTRELFVRAKTRPPELVDRIRAMLRTELARNDIRLPKGSDCRVEASPCEPVFDFCLSRADYLASLLETFGPDAASATPELMELLKYRNVRSETFARNALVEAQSPEVVPHVRSMFTSPQPACRRAALSDLRTLGPVAKPAIPDVLTLLDDPNTRAEGAMTLAALGDERGLPVLAAALEQDDDPDALERTIWALSALGSKAKPALTSLARVARTHWSPQVREKASKAIVAVGGLPLDPRPARCGPAIVSGPSGHWIVSVSGGEKVALTDVEEWRHSHLSDCEITRTINYGTETFRAVVQGRCFAGVAGEFGYLAMRGPGDLEESVGRGSPVAVVKTSSGWVVLNSWSMSMASGWVTRLELLPGTAKMTSSTRLPGSPIAFGKTRDGRLVLATTEEMLREGCDKQPRYVLVLNSDGRLSEITP